MASPADIAAAQASSSRRQTAGAGATASDLTIAATQRTARRSAIVLWLGVTLAFLMLASAWFFLIRAAREAKVESVPLAAPGGKP